MHIGIDTVSLKGAGFTPRVRQGDKVEAGAPLIDFDSTSSLPLPRACSQKSSLVTVTARALFDALPVGSKQPMTLS